MQQMEALSGGDLNFLLSDSCSSKLLLFVLSATTNIFYSAVSCIWIATQIKFKYLKLNDTGNTWKKKQTVH